ncbi:MAG TPA: PEP-CTERM sorting domain-containing protein [Bryobacteraceae bacterium]|nr:PEP-CTERM sorting domain-containing protein [Bryobacteraceae bacterium]
MKVTITRKGLGLALGLLLASGAALADPMVGAGSFNAAGTVYVSTTALDFGLIVAPPPGDQLASINLPTTGAFSYLTATEQIGMKNLNIAAATVSATDINFDGAMPDWITLPGGIDLSLTDIPISSDPICSAATENTVGTVCRAYAGSPIVLHQNSTGVTASMNLKGDAYFTSSPTTLTPYNGEFSADFTGSEGTISGLIGAFNSTGSITTGFSSNFSTVPEPGTVTALGFGLLVIGLINKKKRTAKKNM